MQPPSVKEMTIKARLKKGDTLQITFDDGGEPKLLWIEGWGQVRLRIRSEKDVAAEWCHAAQESDGAGG